MRATDIYTFSDDAEGIADAISHLKDALNTSRYAISRSDDANTAKGKLALEMLADIERTISELEHL